MVRARSRGGNDGQRLIGASSVTVGTEWQGSATQLCPGLWARPIDPGSMRAGPNRTRRKGEGSDVHVQAATGGAVIG